MSSNSEAPQSVSSVVYYRGVAMTITKRDTEALIKPLIEAQMKMIDWALDEKACKPSWNEETNKQMLAKNTNVNHPETQEDLGNCNKCGAANKLSAKGKPYCSAKCWL